MSNLYFLSSNVNKYEEIRPVLERHGILLKFRCTTLPELQADSLDRIALEKGKVAFKFIAKPVIVEDDGLLIHTLGGFPGPYSSFISRTIGNKGILRLLSNSKDRSASFISVFVYTDGNVTRRFVGKVDGKISSRPKGRGWGYDPVFIPSGSKQTFGQLGNGKIYISHRALALSSFARWYFRHKSRTQFIKY
jgi:XTP/dITP diphosphohydrolase